MNRCKSKVPMRLSLLTTTSLVLTMGFLFWGAGQPGVQLQAAAPEAKGSGVKPPAQNKLKPMTQEMRKAAAIRAAKTLTRTAIQKNQAAAPAAQNNNQAAAPAVKKVKKAAAMPMPDASYVTALFRTHAQLGLQSCSKSSHRVHRGCRRRQRLYRCHSSYGHHYRRSWHGQRRYG